ncbi:MAG TPA: carbamoyl phosphate synthase small subunit [Candidatus Eisenbacteria bacterium]
MNPRPQGPLAALRPHDALLALEDGTVFPGWSCGAPGEMSGELVFNTSMMGYPEIITDPSYRGQIVTFTYPLIGNYGINAADAESPKPCLSGVVVRTMCGEPSSWRSKETLPDYLRRHRVVAIEGVDTRALTRRLRSAGVMRAVLSTKDLDPASLVAKAKASPGLVGRDLVAEVTPFEATPWLAAAERPALPVAVLAELPAGTDRFVTDDAIAARLRELPPEIELTDDDILLDETARVDVAAMAVEAAIEARRSGGPMVLPTVETRLKRPSARSEAERPTTGEELGASGSNTELAVANSHGELAPRIAILHCGMKANIAEELRKRGARVRVWPAATPIATILADKPDGLLLSNGPGDPEGVDGVVEEVRAALGQVPIFGICLGIQMLALAFGGKTYKLKFGHRGGNQPVLDLTTGKVEITAQNHGFAVDPESLKTGDTSDRRHGLSITHINLNDGTVEGFQHPGLDVVAVQYHPEAAPGPHDAAYLFDRFLERVRTRMARTGVN